MKILDRSPVPVYPMALRGLWGSIFSRGRSNPFERAFSRGPFSKLELVVGDVMTADQVTPIICKKK